MQMTAGIVIRSNNNRIIIKQIFCFWYFFFQTWICNWIIFFFRGWPPIRNSTLCAGFMSFVGFIIFFFSYLLLVFIIYFFSNYNAFLYLGLVVCIRSFVFFFSYLLLVFLIYFFSDYNAFLYLGLVVCIRSFVFFFFYLLLVFLVYFFSNNYILFYAGLMKLICCLINFFRYFFFLRRINIYIWKCYFPYFYRVNESFITFLECWLIYLLKSIGVKVWSIFIVWVSIFINIFTEYCFIISFKSFRLSRS